MHNRQWRMCIEEYLVRGSEAESLSGKMAKLVHHIFDLSIDNDSEIPPLLEVLTDQSIGVLVRSYDEYGWAK